MGFNVSASMGYQLENSEFLRSAAKNILNRSASPETTQRIIEKTLFNSDVQLRELYTNPQLSVIKASTQISINNSLKETLKYLKNHANKKSAKAPVLGELWNIFSSNNEASEKNPYKGELYDFEIDKKTSPQKAQLVYQLRRLVIFQLLLLLF